MLGSKRIFCRWFFSILLLLTYPLQNPTTVLGKNTHRASKGTIVTISRDYNVLGGIFIIPIARTNSLWWLEPSIQDSFIVNVLDVFHITRFSVGVGYRRIVQPKRIIGSYIYVDLDFPTKETAGFQLQRPLKRPRYTMNLGIESITIPYYISVNMYTSYHATEDLENHKNEDTDLFRFNSSRLEDKWGLDINYPTRFEMDSVLL